MKSLKESPNAYRVADTFSKVSYSAALGGLIQGVTSNNGLAEIAIGRAYATIPNLLSGRLQTWVGEKAYRLTNTKQESSEFRKTLLDLVAFNLIETPIYTSSLMVGNLAAGKELDWKEIAAGATMFMGSSILVAPTWRMYTNFVRKRLGLKTIAEKAEEEQEDMFL